MGGMEGGSSEPPLDLSLVLSSLTTINKSRMAYIGDLPCISFTLSR